MKQPTSQGRQPVVAQERVDHAHLLIRRCLTILVALLVGWSALGLIVEAAAPDPAKEASREPLPVERPSRVLTNQVDPPAEDRPSLSQRLVTDYSQPALLAAAGVLLGLAGSYFLVRIGKGRELALSAGTTLVMLLLVELAFRMFGITGYHLPRTREWSHALVAPADRAPGVSIQFKPDSSFRFCYDSNPRGYFDADNCLTYTLNNHGFRDHDYSLQKSPGIRRVLLLGDSFAFGEGVKPEHMFSNLLEKRLSASGNDVEVLNFSVGGWGTRDEITYLEAEGLAFSPDLVLVAYVLNDADYAGGLDVWEGFRRQYEKSWLRFSAFLSYAYAQLGQRMYVRRYVENMTTRALNEEDKWNSSFRYLHHGKRLAESSGARFAVAVLPFMYTLTADYPFLPIHEMIVEYCKSQGIPARDLFTSFSGIHHAELWVHPSDPHPNERGHRLIADALADFVLGEQLLPGIENTPSASLSVE